jgi:putative endonuclease
MQSSHEYYVYLLECEDKTIYTGITTDIARRLQEHQTKTGAHYTAAHGAKKILYSEQYASRSEALVREAEIKKWERKKKLSLIAQKQSPIKKNVRKH